MTDELKPVNCGCGGEAWTDYIIGEPSEGVGWFVCCKNCEIQLPAEYSTEAEAVEAWNRAMSGAKDINVPNKFATDTNVGDKERTAKVETVEKPNVFKCGECGQYFHSTSWGSPVEYCSRCGCRLEWNE